MADFTHTTALTWSGTGSASFGGSLADSGDGEDNRNLTITAGSEPAVDMQIPAGARLLHLFFLSDQAVTLRTNGASTGTPADTIVLTANAPYSYSASTGTTGPFSVDVTSMFIQNATTADATVRLRVLKDSTV